MSRYLSEAIAETTEAHGGEEGGEHDKPHSIVLLGVLTAFIVLFFFIEGLMHKYHPKVGHETGLILVLGFVFSVSYFYAHGITKNDYELFQFKPDLFFNMLLPPIILNAGYNMRQKKFFTNIGNIAITGLCVTFVNFAIYSAATYYVLKYLDLKMTRYQDNLHPEVAVPETYPIEMTFMQILMFTSLMCSSDVVAAVSIVDFKAQPKLYSCIFGEGVFNDIVSIVLFNTVLNLQGKEFSAKTPFIIIGQFISIALVSAAVGAAYGISLTLAFKHMRFMTRDVKGETFLITAVGLLSYFTTHGIVILGVEMSGIIALLVYAIIQGHYNWYNLSPQAKATVGITIEFLGKTSEAAVYSYVGISLYTAIPGFWSAAFIGWQMLIICGGRVIGVLFTFYAFRLCFRKKTITFKELLFITWGGMIRGAIAFALVILIPFKCPTEEECMEQRYVELQKSTCLMVVVFTTLIFGTFMKLAQTCLLAKDTLKSQESTKSLASPQDGATEEQLIVESKRRKSLCGESIVPVDHNDIKLDGFQEPKSPIEAKLMQSQSKLEALAKSQSNLGLTNSKLINSMMAAIPSESDHEIKQHPNLEASELSSDDEDKGKKGKPVKFSDSKFVKWFTRFDQSKIRPFLIHNFNEELVHAMRAIDEVYNYDYARDENKEVLEALKAMQQQVKAAADRARAAVAAMKRGELPEFTGQPDKQPGTLHPEFQDQDDEREQEEAKRPKDPTIHHMFELDQPEIREEDEDEDSQDK